MRRQTRKQRELAGKSPKQLNRQLTCAHVRVADAASQLSGRGVRQVRRALPPQG